MANHDGDVSVVQLNSCRSSKPVLKYNNPFGGRRMIFGGNSENEIDTHEDARQAFHSMTEHERQTNSKQICHKLKDRHSASCIINDLEDRESAKETEQFGRINELEELQDINIFGEPIATEHSNEHKSALQTKGDNDMMAFETSCKTPRHARHCLLHGEKTLKSQEFPDIENNRSTSPAMTKINNTRTHQKRGISSKSRYPMTKTCIQGQLPPNKYKILFTRLNIANDTSPQHQPTNLDVVAGGDNSVLKDTVQSPPKNQGLTTKNRKFVIRREKHEAEDGREENATYTIHVHAEDPVDYDHIDGTEGSKRQTRGNIFNQFNTNGGFMMGHSGSILKHCDRTSDKSCLNTMQTHANRAVSLSPSKNRDKSDEFNKEKHSTNVGTTSRVSPKKVEKEKPLRLIDHLERKEQIFLHQEQSIHRCPHGESQYLNLDTSFRKGIKLEVEHLPLQGYSSTLSGNYVSAKSNRTAENGTQLSFKAIINDQGTDHFQNETHANLSERKDTRDVACQYSPPLTSGQFQNPCCPCQCHYQKRQLDSHNSSSSWPKNKKTQRRHYIVGDTVTTKVITIEDTRSRETESAPGEKQLRVNIGKKCLVNSVKCDKDDKTDERVGFHTMSKRNIDVLKSRNGDLNDGEFVESTRVERCPRSNHQPASDDDKDYDSEGSLAGSGISTGSSNADENICKNNSASKRIRHPNYNKSNSFTAIIDEANSENNTCIEVTNLTNCSDNFRSCEDDGNREYGHHFIGDYLLKLWKRQVLCDVRVDVANSHFLAHKLVLAAFSDVFTPVTPYPKPTLCFTVPNATPEVVYKVFNYLYTAQMDVDDVDLEMVLHVGIFLGIPEVKHVILKILSQPTLENLELYIDIQNRCGIPVSLMDYPDIYQNHLRNILQMEKFLQLTPEELEMILRDPEVLVATEEDTLHALASWAQYKPLDRLSEVPRLLDFVIFEVISPEKIARIMELYDPIFSEAASRNKISEVFRFHALHLASKMVGGDDVHVQDVLGIEPDAHLDRVSFIPSQKTLSNHQSRMFMGKPGENQRLVTPAKRTTLSHALSNLQRKARPNFCHYVRPKLDKHGIATVCKKKPIKPDNAVIGQIDLSQPLPDPGDKFTRFADDFSNNSLFGTSYGLDTEDSHLSRYGERYDEWPEEPSHDTTDYPYVWDRIDRARGIVEHEGDALRCATERTSHVCVTDGSVGDVVGCAKDKTTHTRDIDDGDNDVIVYARDTNSPSCDKAGHVTHIYTNCQANDVVGQSAYGSLQHAGCQPQGDPRFCHAQFKHNFEEFVSEHSTESLLAPKTDSNGPNLQTVKNVNSNASSVFCIV